MDTRVKTLVTGLGRRWLSVALLDSVVVLGPVTLLNLPGAVEKRYLVVNHALLAVRVCAAMSATMGSIRDPNIRCHAYPR